MNLARGAALPASAVEQVAGASVISEPRDGRLVGEHRHHTRCRFCLGEALHPFLDFGLVPLAGGFHPRGSTAQDFCKERLYPLRICVCTHCFLVQVDNAVPANVLFKNYFYFSSAIRTLGNHFNAYAQEVAREFPDPTKITLLELGCNDGVFLIPLRSAGFQVIGVDPATNVVDRLIHGGYDIVNEYFTEAVAKDILRRRGPVDAIFSSNSFAHIDDMHEVMRGVKILLKPEGYLAFEVHYVGILLKETQYDMMYHEHLSYYSLTAIETFLNFFDMQVFDVQPIPIHGGSIRFRAQRRQTGIHTITPTVARMRRQESEWGLSNIGSYVDFCHRVNQTRNELLNLLDGLIKNGKRIVGYGASGRATALSSYCGLRKEHLEAVIDDAPAKLGAFTPGNHLPIVSSAMLTGPNRPDYTLLFAWTFAGEICKSNQAYFASGGKFIIPLPNVRIIDASDGPSNIT